MRAGCWRYICRHFNCCSSTTISHGKTDFVGKGVNCSWSCQAGHVCLSVDCLHYMALHVGKVVRCSIGDECDVSEILYLLPFEDSSVNFDSVFKTSFLNYWKYYLRRFLETPVVKLKLSLYRLWRRVGGVESWLHSRLDGGKWLTLRLSALPLEKPEFLCNKRLSGPQTRSGPLWRRENLFFCLDSNPRPLQLQRALSTTWRSDLGFTEPLSQ